MGTLRLRYAPELSGRFWRSHAPSNWSVTLLPGLSCGFASWRLCVNCGSWDESPPTRSFPSEARRFTTPAPLSRQSADHLGHLLGERGPPRQAHATAGALGFVTAEPAKLANGQPETPAAAPSTGLRELAGRCNWAMHAENLTISSPPRPAGPTAP